MLVSCLCSRPKAPGCLLGAWGREGRQCLPEGEAGKGTSQRRRYRIDLSQPGSSGRDFCGPASTGAVAQNTACSGTASCTALLKHDKHSNEWLEINLERQAVVG